MSSLLEYTYCDYPITKPSWFRFCVSISRCNSNSVQLLFRFLNKCSSEGIGYGKMLIFKLLNMLYVKYCNRLNVFLPINTSIGDGLIFPHAFPLVVNPESKIGKCCIIHPCVLIGRDRGKEGAPVIGDYVFIGHGTKIIGNPKIGDWTFISPGAVITKDIPVSSLVGAGVNNIINNQGRKHVIMYLPKEYYQDTETNK